MIVVSIHGGLGNQMFQYAFARAVSERLKVPLILDTSFYDSSTNLSLQHPRSFGLDVFNISGKVANNSQLARFVCHDKRIHRRILFKISQIIYGKSTFKERNPLCFEPNSLTIKDNTYLTGYWQSEKYFLEIRDVLLQEFSLKKANSRAIHDIEKQMLSCNSVSIHIRRGDYTLENTKSFHGLLPMNYYTKAIKILMKSVNNPTFFIFSDDPEWVQVNFKLNCNYHIVSGIQIKEPCEELYLMSRCKNNIIANSSFSWWGAWLNKTSDKIVVAPKNWIVNTPLNAAIIPEKWTGI